MAHLNDELIKKLSELSRIECREEERKTLLKDLESILGYFDRLAEIDTDNVAPCNHVLSEIYNVMREDEVGETLPRNEFLNLAPSSTGGLIKIPSVMNKNIEIEDLE